ncbi:hypothetical protein PIB30_077557 [Stylosanthes scabra]|uniref:Uncharacterized protein n=1 Tax=Stylosanthes scabra TaxID=79078 RepID=A0ABU6WTC5_9FABA|nr:hypothetical protein [Stylosanthes scabra]
MVAGDVALLAEGEGGRGRPRKNTGVQLNLEAASCPSTSTPTATTTTTATITPPFVATGELSVGLPQMIMIPTPGSRVQSFETNGAPQVQRSPAMPETQIPSQTASQPQPTTPATDTDMAEDDAEAAASATTGPRPLLLWDGHDCWDDVRKGTKEITNVFMEHYKWYAPYSAKHRMRRSSSGGKSGGRDSGSWEAMRPTCARLGRPGRLSDIGG